MAGEVFYLLPGHAALIDENAAVVEVSPEQVYAEVLDHVGRKLRAR